MPLDFTPTSIVKGAKRTFTAPITTATTFDAAVAALKADDNPLGATAYQTAGETTRDAYDDIIAEILSATAITTAYAADATACRNTAKDSWNVRLKIHDPTGELYYLNFTRKDLKISSYEADGVAALN